MLSALAKLPPINHSNQSKVKEESKNLKKGGRIAQFPAMNRMENTLTSHGRGFLRLKKAKLNPIGMRQEKHHYPSNNYLYKSVLDESNITKIKQELIQTKAFDGQDKVLTYYNSEVPHARTPCPSPTQPSKALIFKNAKVQQKKVTQVKEVVDPLNLKPAWTLPFKEGSLFRHATAYQEFEKKYKHAEYWLAIEWIISKIESFLTGYGIAYTDVSCAKLVKLSRDSLVWPIRKDQILSCMADPDEVKYDADYKI